MKSRRYKWLGTTMCICTLLLLWSGACGPVQTGPPNKKDGGTQGTEVRPGEQAKTTEKTGTKEQGSTDAGPRDQDLPKDERVQDDTSTKEDRVHDDTTSPEKSVADKNQSGPDTWPTDTTPDTPSKTECAMRNGYCAGPSEKCRSGYQHVNNSFGCKSNCCMPKTPPPCGKLSEKISLNEQCCPGLQKGSAGLPPSCQTTGQTFVCVKCGDGKCDRLNGENPCSCPKDCSSGPKDTCTPNKGLCINSRMRCPRGTRLEPSLTCASKTLACCVKGIATQCKTDADCPQKCSGSGVCTQFKYTCKLGRCVESSQIKQPNASCNASTGTCERIGSGQCKTHCDCKQGLMCVRGPTGSSICIPGTKPVYCCDKPGCPAGQACTTSSGAQSTCRTTQTDCEKKGGYCGLQFTKCKAGYKQVSTPTCNARSLHCCMPIKNLCLNVKCPKPTCLGDRLGCKETEYICNPANGKCEPHSKAHPPSCKAGLTKCVEVRSACSNNQCVGKAREVKARCMDTRAGCMQEVPTCSTLQLCSSTSKLVLGARCDTASGLCKKQAPTTCKHLCDCQQGLICVGGACKAGFAPAYCCDKPGCPRGQKCSSRLSGPGVCR